MKLLGNAGATAVFLLFLVLIGDDCLHWYALPLSNDMHRNLFAAMIVLLSLMWFLMLRNLIAIRQLWAKVMLKLVSTPAEIETEVESIMRLSRLSLMLALCFYTFAFAWSIFYLSHGPIIETGYAALFIFLIYCVTAVLSIVKLERFKRSIQLRRAEAKPEQPAA